MQLHGQPKAETIQRQCIMDPTTFPAVKSSPGPSLQSMQPVPDEQSSTLPRVLATTRRATKEGIRRPGDFNPLSTVTEVETVMPVSPTWLDNWEIVEGNPEGHPRFRAILLTGNATHGELYSRDPQGGTPEGPLWGSRFTYESVEAGLQSDAQPCVLAPWLTASPPPLLLRRRRPGGWHPVQGSP
jgi:hypothetical protein